MFHDKWMTQHTRIYGFWIRVLRAAVAGGRGLLFGNIVDFKLSIREGGRARQSLGLW